jgi:hypothetical protein
MGEARNPQAVFQGFNGALAAAAPDVLGLWATVPVSSADGVAFATPTILGGAAVWRDNLPADSRQAHADLDRREAKLHATEKALVVAADRLNRFVARQASGQVFDPSAAAGTLAQPEAELLGALSQLRERRPSASFGLGEHLAGGWVQATQQFQVIVDQLQRFVAYYAWVETRVQDQLLAKTIVGWTGDVDITWRAELGAEQVQLHQRTLALALQSRDTLMRTFVMATQFAIKLSIFLSMPGGVILALPAAWQFLHQVLAELGQQS